MPQLSAIFDFDGVIADTEPQYDRFFEILSEKLGIEDFAAKIKGTKIDEALNNNFPQFSDVLKRTIIDATYNFELQMDFPLVPGVMDFIYYLKKENFKIGLVTSSHSDKMKIAMDKLNINGLFDTEVMAERITRGKPDPMCYLTAAEDLKVSPGECVVFEDSIAGTAAGRAAGMTVIGVTTTLSEETLKERVDYIISDFRNFQNLPILKK